MTYRFHKSLIDFYYNVIGYDQGLEVLPDFIDCKDVSDLDVYLKMKVVTSNTKKVNEEMLYFLDNISRITEDYSNEYGFSEFIGEYIMTYQAILAICCNINVCGKEYNSKEYNERLDAILYPVLSELNSLDPNDVIDFYDAIRSKSYQIILSLDALKAIPYTMLLVLLGIHPNNELDDSVIFDEDNSINFKRLLNHVHSNLFEENNVNIDSFNDFVRPPLSESFSLNK